MTKPHAKEKLLDLESNLRMPEILEAKKKERKREKIQIKVKEKTTRAHKVGGLF